MKRFRSSLTPYLAVLCVILLVSVGCATKWHALTGFAIWQKNNIASYNALIDDPDLPYEEKAWLDENVGPYINIFTHALKAIAAYERDDDVGVANHIRKMFEWATNIDYDPTNLAKALRGDELDQDTIEFELDLIKVMIGKMLARWTG
jgi:hypothetical protein